MSWQTYLIMHFGTNGTKNPTEIAQEIEKIGFVTHFGSVDFIYRWSKKPSKQEVLRLGDRIAEVLKGSGAVFNLDTHD